MIDSPAALLRRLFDTALAAVSAERCLPRFLPPPPRGRCVVVGAGKAAAAMASVVGAHWQGQPDRLSGLVVTRSGQGRVCQRIEVLEASHPLPDAAAVQAALRMLALLADLTPEDQVLALISGGGSALMTLPAEGVTLADKRAITQALLRSGATIGEINTVRKHLSAIKGGRLAWAARPAHIVTLAISDVAGDDIGVIASGSTVADPTSCQEALAVIDRYAIALPPAIRQAWQRGELETPKPGELPPGTTHIVASGLTALQAAAEVARAAGIMPIVLGDAIEGEAREVAKAMAGIALSCLHHGYPARPPCVLLSGGETTVTLCDSDHIQGRGGRNSEFALALALALDGAPGIYALAADTDGIDGDAQAAGAIVTPNTLARARTLGRDARAHLAAHDAATFFAALGDLLITGPGASHTQMS